MKKLILVIGIAISSATVATVMAAPVNLTSFLVKVIEYAAFSWNVTTHDFGKIKVNVPVTHQFNFTNTGASPLIISSVQASCGCTVTEYTTDAVEPGDTGFVKATFNAAHVGVFTKSVTVNANTEHAQVQLMIKGEVIE